MFFDEIDIESDGWPNPDEPWYDTDGEPEEPEPEPEPVEE